MCTFSYIFLTDFHFFANQEPNSSYSKAPLLCDSLQNNISHQGTLQRLPVYEDCLTKRYSIKINDWIIFYMRRRYLSSLKFQLRFAIPAENRSCDKSLHLSIWRYFFLHWHLISLVCFFLRGEGIFFHIFFYFLRLTQFLHTRWLVMRSRVKMQFINLSLRVRNTNKSNMQHKCCWSHHVFYLSYAEVSPILSTPPLKKKKKTKKTNLSKY